MRQGLNRRMMMTDENARMNITAFPSRGSVTRYTRVLSVTLLRHVSLVNNKHIRS